MLFVLAFLVRFLVDLAQTTPAERAARDAECLRTLDAMLAAWQPQTVQPQAA